MELTTYWSDLWIFMQNAKLKAITGLESLMLLIQNNYNLQTTKIIHE